MTIFGRDYDFLYSVGAEQEIAQLCPGGSIANLREVVTGKSAEDGLAEIACILSRWHEKAAALAAGREPEPALTRETVACMSVGAFQELQREILACMKRDQARSVDAEAPKKDAAPRSS